MHLSNDSAGYLAGVRENPGPGGVIRSDSCTWDQLCVAEPVGREARDALDLKPGWSRLWSATWKVGAAEVVSPVRDMHAAPIGAARPVRRFSFTPAQRHRPGLAYQVGTGGLHGFESHKESMTLLALDFGGAEHVLSQPFTLRYGAKGRSRTHVPDILAATPEGMWLIDVRPAAQIKEEDRVAFAAAAEAALACGWRYAVVAGWPPQTVATLEAISAQRRELVDHFGLEPQLLAAAHAGRMTFGELVDTTGLPAVARAHAVHLLWNRRLGVDLAAPLTDSSSVWAGGAGR